jgi:hypothetical protein
MKWLLMTFLIIPHLGFARDREILKCLGVEEKAYHQAKTMGPLYELNQRIISEMIQISHVELEPKAFTHVCLSTKPSQSLRLLKLSLAQGKEIFVMASDINGMQKQMTQGMIDDYVELSKEIFMNFMAQVQSFSPTPTCLEDSIPGLKDFLFEFKYLQEDVDVKQIFKGRDLAFFDKLSHYPKMFQACKDRLKKKLKPKSTSSAKKR